MFLTHYNHNVLVETMGYDYFVKLLDYLKRNNILFTSFKFKDFVKGEEYQCYGGVRRFKDIGIKPGHLMYAFTYGLNHNYIRKISSHHRRLDLDVLRGDGFNV